MPTKNLEQLVVTRALVKEEIRQGKWDQGTWTGRLEEDPETGLSKVTCGTTACVAGWAVIASGAEFVSYGAVVATEAERADPELKYDVFDKTIYTESGAVRNFTVVPVRVRAQRLLGLDDFEGQQLFRADNTEDIVMHLLDRHIKEARKDRKKAAKRAAKKENAR